jgi:hypothetical protein
MIYDIFTPIAIINRVNGMQNSTAKNLNPEQRKNIAINVVANYQTITTALRRDDKEKINTTFYLQDVAS